MTASNNNNAHAVFISYASEDAEAAGCIAASLEAAGIEVGLDKTIRAERRLTVALIERTS
jgi:hypothetical protein